LSNLLEGDMAGHVHKHYNSTSLVGSWFNQIPDVKHTRVGLSVRGEFF